MLFETISNRRRKVGQVFHVDFSAGKLVEAKPEQILGSACHPGPAYCDPSNEWKGEKYDGHRDVADVAKMIRKDIKQAKKGGAIPKAAKISVRISRYSMGCTLYVNVVSAPFQVHAPEWLTWYIEDPHASMFDSPCDRMTDEAKSLKETLKQIVLSYKRDNSDSQSDYWDVNFYHDVDFDSGIWNAEMRQAKDA
jgi:hypothetical protein